MVDRLAISGRAVLGISFWMASAWAARIPSKFVGRKCGNRAFCVDFSDFIGLLLASGGAGMIAFVRQVPASQ